MARYKIRTNQYCALAQEQKWQSWLFSVCQELGEDLLKHLEHSRSCKSNKAKMMDIQIGLEKRKLLPQMIEFLKKEYPYTVDEIQEGNKKTINRQKKARVLSNVKEVFEHYHPNLLTFPQKIVFENDNVESLLREVREFCQGKVGVDYIIIKDKAYVEYFKLKFAKEAKKISKHRREICQYRLKHGLAEDIRVVK
jgi:hypothetical protein